MRLVDSGRTGTRMWSRGRSRRLVRNDLDQRRRSRFDRDDPFARASAPRFRTARLPFNVAYRTRIVGRRTCDPQDVAGVSHERERTIFTGRADDHVSSPSVFRRKRAKAEPSPAMMLSTVPLNFLPLYVSTRISTSCPGGSARCPFPEVRHHPHLSRAATARATGRGTTWPPRRFSVTYPSRGERTAV